MDRLARQLSGEAEIVRLNALSHIGREGVYRYGIRGVPTLIVIDGCGDEVYRQVGLVIPAQVVSAVRSSSACLQE